MSTKIEESARQLPVVGHYDVIVCGGGPAGVAAALSAARNGAQTLLLEKNGCLGGVWTAGLLSHIVDHEGKSGILQEILSLLRREGAQRWATDYDIESMKFVLEELCLQAGIEVQLHTSLASAQVEGREVKAVITEGFSGREAWTAKVFIDCTGNGDLAARCGCGFDFGAPGSQSTQPMSMVCLMTGLDMQELDKIGMLRTEEPGEKNRRAKDVFLAELRKAGYEPTFGRPTLNTIRADLFQMMINHEHGSGINGRDVSRATLHGRAETYSAVKALRQLGGIWRNLRIVATSEQIGIREGRRIHGRYKLTIEDAVSGARFHDGVVRAAAPIDIHGVDPQTGLSVYSNAGFTTKPFDIPLRSLISADRDNLLMAGRCISGDSIVHGSYRVTGNAVVMGEAAGVAASSFSKGVAFDEMFPEDVPAEALS